MLSFEFEGGAEMGGGNFAEYCVQGLCDKSMLLRKLHKMLSTNLRFTSKCGNVLYRKVFVGIPVRYSSILVWADIDLLLDATEPFVVKVS